MSADYVGALAAIRQRFVDNWTVTPIAYVNEPFTAPADPTSGVPQPWVFFEVVNSGSKVETVGGPGNNAVVYYGLIKGHVFAPINTATTGCYANAVAIGEIFRNKLFFDDVTPGCFVRSGYRLDEQPRIDEGDASIDDGEWFAVTATIPFEYWHRA